MKANHRTLRPQVKCLGLNRSGASTLLTLVFLLGCSGCVAQIEQGSIEHDELVRTYSFHVPASYDPSVPSALVFVLHGGNGTARKMAYLTRFTEIAEREGFIVVYPQGTSRQWNDGRAANAHGVDVSHIDDVGFISALIDRFSSEFSIDPARVYATGVSNGGMMSQRLACELSDRIAAVAPVIGSMPEKLAGSCAPAKSVSILMINGKEDWLVPWAGGAVGGRPAWGRVLSAEDTVNLWVARNQCSATPEIIWEPDTAPHDGTRVRRWTYSGGLDGAEVVLYEIEGGGHTWPGGAPCQHRWLLGRVSQDINASEIIWEFFKKHPGK